MRLLAVTAAAAAVALATGTAGCGPSDASTRVEVGAPAPDYRAVSIEGDSVSLADHRGRVVLFNVWATWCHPCRAEIPELRELHAKHQDRGFEVVGVSVDASGADAAIRSFMDDFEMHYPVWRDPDERVSARFLVFGVPATFLIDREGILRWRKIGPIQPDDPSLASAIEQALGPASAP